MLKKFFYVFLISMVPLVELRGAIPYSQVMGLPILQSYIVCIIGNMLPVPVIYLFARKVLEWGADKPVIGGFFSFCLEKGEKGGKSREGLVFGAAFVCRDSHSGDGRMDRDPCGKHSGHGFQVQRCSRHVGRAACRRNYGGCKRNGRWDICVKMKLLGADKSSAPFVPYLFFAAFSANSVVMSVPYSGRSVSWPDSSNMSSNSVKASSVKIRSFFQVSCSL